MIKILFFIPKLSGGGAEKVLRNLVNNMDQSKFDITVQTIEKEDSEKYLSTGIRYKSINNCKTAIGKKIFDYWIRICAELKIMYPLYMKDDYDIEVAYLECGATKMLAHSTNKKAVKLAWVHCDLSKKEGVIQSVERLKKYYGKYDKVVCVSETARKSYELLFGNKTSSVVLYNVNDEKEILSKAKSIILPEKACTRIVSVGRLSSEKGVDRLIEACNRLKQNNYTFETLILGEGNERSNLECLIEKYNLKDEVKLLGFVNNPYPYMESADVIVCSSFYEGFSTVVTESVILGKPVVTTPCAGMDEILGNSEYGIITEDSVEGIYNGIKTLLDSEEKRRAYAEKSAQRGKDFSKELLLGKIELFLKQELVIKKKIRG